MTAEPTTWALLFLLGTTTGLLAGIFGVGGGLLIVPALTLWGLPLAQATATSLTLAQRQLRLALEQTQFGIKNQLGKLTRRPTLRWVFQCFQAVHLITIDGIKQIANLTPERLDILRFFPPSCRHYYLLS